MIAPDEEQFAVHTALESAGTFRPQIAWATPSARQHAVDRHHDSVAMCRQNRIPEIRESRNRSLAMKSITIDESNC